LFAQDLVDFNLLSKAIGKSMDLSFIFAFIFTPVFPLGGGEVAGVAALGGLEKTQLPANLDGSSDCTPRWDRAKSEI